MRELINTTSTYVGMDPKDFWLIILMCTVALVMFGLFYLQHRSVKKEYEQTKAEAKPDGTLKRYTKGNYALDVKQFVTLYRKAETVPELKALKTVVNRIMDNVDKIEMMGRNSYNGRLWAGIHDTYKACQVTKQYLDMGYKSLDLIRNVVYFEVRYYNEEKNDDVLGVSRVVRNETHLTSAVFYKYNRMPKQQRRSRIRRANAKINYDVKLNRYGTRKSLASVKDIIEGK
jgi:hypothetical protein